MMDRTRDLSHYNCLKRLIKDGKHFRGMLLLSLFISYPLISHASTSTIDTNVLNDLTAPKVEWEEVGEAGSDVVFINGKYYKYTYNQPTGYK